MRVMDTEIDRVIQRRIDVARRNEDRRIAALLSAPMVEKPFDTSAACAAFESVRYSHWEADRSTVQARGARRVVSRMPCLPVAPADVELKPPVTVCATIYRLAVEIEGVPRGAVICSRCEEVWDLAALRAACEHENKGFCVVVAVEYRSASARAFYEWCRAQGYIEGIAQGNGRQEER